VHGAILLPEMNIQEIVRLQVNLRSSMYILDIGEVAERTIRRAALGATLL
jgi:hypothetical protein